MHWEYQVIRADWFNNKVAAIRPYGGPTVSLEDYLNSVGAEGWEVVGAAAMPTISEMGRFVVVLKRQTPD